MEKVKEESRRKSEELERLKRSVQERSQTSKKEYPAIQQSHTPMYQRPSQKTSYDDDFIMDFSKPAGYKPPVSYKDPEPEVEYTLPRRMDHDDVVIRRRSLEPKKEEEKPPLPSLPPPRRTNSRDSQGKPPVPPHLTPANQHQKLMEEIRNSSNRRLRMNECVVVYFDE